MKVLPLRVPSKFYRAICATCGGSWAVCFHQCDFVLPIPTPDQVLTIQATYALAVHAGAIEETRQGTLDKLLSVLCEHKNERRNGSVTVIPDKIQICATCGGYWLFCTIKHSKKLDPPVTIRQIQEIRAAYALSQFDPDKDILAHETVTKAQDILDGWLANPKRRSKGCDFTPHSGAQLRSRKVWTRTHRHHYAIRSRLTI